MIIYLFIYLLSFYVDDGSFRRPHVLVLRYARLFLQVHSIQNCEKGFHEKKKL
jgi:hypothetical protein